VAGSRRIAALGEAVAALQIALDAQDWADIWQAAAGHELP
jgi:predicted oxidoreductase